MEELYYWNIGVTYQHKDKTQGLCDLRYTRDKKIIGGKSMDEIRQTVSDEIGLPGPEAVVITHISYLGYMTAEEYEES